MIDLFKGLFGRSINDTDFKRPYVNGSVQPVNVLSISALWI